ncbi:TfoX/Sxy family protein [Labilibacter sediminis]|nr:TfoX/Sxy family protein [Labilibacter sediminis]
MKKLTDLPNIGSTLAAKLERVEILSPEELKAIGSEKAILKIMTVYKKDACINMLYALEGAVQGIRWHELSRERKQELKEFYEMMKIG